MLETDDAVIDMRVEQKIDYEPVRKALEAERRKSVEWLENAIKKEKRNELSLYDVVQKEMMVCEEKLEWQKNVIDAQGNVIGAHDKRFEVYDVALRQLQEDAKARRIVNETQQLQMQEFQDAIIGLRETSARLLEENQGLHSQIESLQNQSFIKRLIRKIRYK